MKTQQEIKSLLDEARDMPTFNGLDYQDGIIAALEWVLGSAQDKPTE